MCLTPDTRNFKYLNFYKWEILCRAQKKFFLKCPDKILCEFFVWKILNFLSPSKDDILKVVFAWT